MVIEEIIPNRIRDLLAAATDQHSMVRRLIIEVEPQFHPSRLRYLLAQDSFPVAVNPNLIVDTGDFSDKMNRATSILEEYVKEELFGKKFLDFGAGEGHIARKAFELGANSVGYDIVEQWDTSLNNENGFFLTCEWDNVISNAPYDFILVYDVLDHSKEEPVEILKKLSLLLNSTGKIFLICHPWCSRHGNHSYLKCNKAFIHLFFNEEELEEMGCEGIFTRKILHPIATYDDWILKSGLVKVNEIIKRSPTGVEPIFQEEPILVRLIKEHWKNSYDGSLASGTKFPKNQMEQSFNFYTLERKSNQDFVSYSF